MCDYSNTYIIVKGNITVVKKIFTAAHFEAPNNTVNNANVTNTVNNNMFGEKKLLFKNQCTIYHLSIVFQKLMVWKLIMQKI